MRLARFVHVALALVALLAAPASAQEDALGVPGPIVFEGTEFLLAWTSHPDPAYYKQEYVPAGEVVERYTQMFMIDAVIEDVTPENAAGAMVSGLEERKASDPLVNYALIQNDATGEIILDFLLSDESTGTTIVEWNAYRYVPLDRGVALFAISRRGYGEEASAFIADLGTWRAQSIDALASMETPQLTPAD